MQMIVVVLVTTMFLALGCSTGQPVQPQATQSSRPAPSAQATAKPTAKVTAKPAARVKLTSLKAQEGLSPHNTWNVLVYGTLEITEGMQTPVMAGYKLLTGSGEFLDENTLVPMGRTYEYLGGGKVQWPFEFYAPAYEKAEYIEVNFFLSDSKGNPQERLGIDGVQTKIPILVPKR